MAAVEFTLFNQQTKNWEIWEYLPASVGEVYLTKEQYYEKFASDEQKLEDTQRKYREMLSLEFAQNLEDLKGGLELEGIGKVDCGKQHLTNVNGLIEALEYKKLLDPVNENPVVPFRLYENDVVELNLDQLKTIKMALILKGQELYANKWRNEQIIDSATSRGEIQTNPYILDLRDTETIEKEKHQHELHMEYSLLAQEKRDGSLKGEKLTRFNELQSELFAKEQETYAKLLKKKGTSEGLTEAEKQELWGAAHLLCEPDPFAEDNDKESAE